MPPAQHFMEIGQGGLRLPWASHWEAVHDRRCYWPEQGFGWWTFVSGEETGCAFQVHAAHWLCRQVPSQCLPEVCLTSLAEGRYQTGAATRWAKKIETRERKARMTDSDHYKVMKAKKMRSRIAKLEVRKLQKATLLKASPQKSSCC